MSINALTRDGLLGVGSVNYNQSGRGDDPITWTAAAGRVTVNDGAFENITLYLGVSSDGQIVAGRQAGSGSVYSSRPFRRIGSGSLDFLPMPAGFTYGFTVGMSDDGNAIAGYWFKVVGSSSSVQPFIWTPEGGTVLIGQLSYLAEASAISRDGTTVVGSGNGGGFVWTQAGGFQYLPSPVPGGSTEADAVNSTGSMIAGIYGAGTTRGLARWTNGVPQALATGAYNPKCLSDDGNIICITANTTPLSAWVWTPQGGVVTAAAFLQQRGVSLPAGLTLYQITAMTPEGRTFAGFASLNGSGGAFVARTPACGSADFNHDGDSGADTDIEAFFACIAGSCCPTCDSADFNGDGDTATDSDIEAFFRVIAGGHC